MGLEWSAWEMQERKIGIAISYVNIFIHAIVGFIYVPILLHYIGKSEYGLYQLIGSLIAYFTVMDFGLTAAVTRFYAKYRALQDRNGMENILAISIYGYIGVTIFVLLVGGVCYFFFDSIFSQNMSRYELTEAKEMFLLLLFNIAITLSTMVFKAVINAYEKFLFLKGMETIQLVIQPVLVVLLLQQYPNAFSVALVQTGINIFLIISRIYYCYVKLHINIKFHYWSKELFADFKRLALSVFAVVLIDQVFWKTNQVILGIVRGTDAVAVYSIASIVYMNYMALSTAISGVYLPHITGMVAKKEGIDKLSALFIQVGRWQYYLLALVLSGFIIFGKQFIDIWAGKGFEDAYWITIIIIIPFTIDLIQNIGLAILQAENKYDFRAKVYFCVGLFNLILAIPLGKFYGGIGCAIATGIAMFLGNGIIMNWFYATQIGLQIKEFWQQIIQITIPVIILGGIGMTIQIIFQSSHIGLFIVMIVTYVLIYGLVMYKYCMKKEEKNKVQYVYHKLVHF